METNGETAMTDTYTPVLTDAEIECLLSFGCHPMTSLHAIGRAIERAAIKAYQKRHPPIPDGWALVPVEPTEAMINAAPTPPETQP